MAGYSYRTYRVCFCLSDGHRMSGLLRSYDGYMAQTHDGHLLHLFRRQHVVDFRMITFSSFHDVLVCYRRKKAFRYLYG